MLETLKRHTDSQTSAIDLMRYYNADAWIDKAIIHPQNTSKRDQIKSDQIRSSSPFSSVFSAFKTLMSFSRELLLLSKAQTEAVKALL